jgi:hypothetical protein
MMTLAHSHLNDAMRCDLDTLLALSVGLPASFFFTKKKRLALRCVVCDRKLHELTSVTTSTFHSAQ